MDSTSQGASRQFSLVESLAQECWIKLPRAVMCSVGPATQTLGGLLKVSNRETFAAVELIAEKACLPEKTCRNHLDRLHDAGWILNAGRQRTRAGRPRRTCTIRITTKAKEALSLYGILPRWACCQAVKMPWCAKAVLSIIMVRLASLVKVVNEQDGKADLDAEDMTGSLVNLDGSDGWRWRWSLKQLSERKGLALESVVQGKSWLAEHGVINWGSTTGRYGGSGRDILEPSDSFRAVETQAGDGRVYLDFRS